jgi:PAS domain S-box-containing protein
MKLPDPSLVRKIIENSNDIIIVLDDSDQVMYVNPAFCQILGYQVEKIIGKEIDFLCPDLTKRIDESRTSGNINTQLALRKFSSQRKNGGEILADAEIIFHPRCEDGNSAFVVIACNISEVSLLRRQLTEVQRMHTVQSLVSGAGRELNRELSIIIAITDELEDMIKDKEVSRKMTSIASACFRAAGIVKGMQAIKRKPRQKDNSAILVYKAIYDIVTDYNSVMFRDIDIDYHCPDPRIKVEVDPGKFQQVILNLLINAKEALAGIKNPLITISIRLAKISEGFAGAPRDKFVVIEIQDNGIGMDEETRGKAFVPSFSTKASDQRGMGLYVCKEIIKERQGFIRVDSIEHFGTKFTIFLPATDNTSTQEIVRMEGSLEGTETLLYFEENANLQRRISDRLESNGYSVIKIELLEQAFHLWQKNKSKTDALIFSLWGEAERYLQVLHSIHQLQPDLPIILVADCINPEMIKDFGDNVLEYPYTGNQIMVRVRKILDS